ncbi:MAG: Ig-like domain-containing protein, partial [Planctomycetota bacterium]
APTASANTVTTNEDEAYVFSASDFNFSDVDEGDTLAAVRITSLPTPGSLDFDGAGVSEDQEISRDDIEAGELTFTPDPDENGTDYATFRFKVSDGTDFSVDDHPMTIDVTPVNDAPIPSTEDFVAIERLETDDPPSELFVLEGAKPGPPDETEEIWINEIVDPPPEFGTLEIGPDKKVLIYTPDVGEVGETDTFQYTIIDEFDAVSDVATGSVFIEPLVRPYARDDSVEVNEDEDIVIDVQANDLFNEGDGIEREFHLVESIDGDDITTTDGWLATEHGAVEIVDGEVEYTPNPDYFGPDTFQYVIDDDVQDSEPSIGTVRIDVLPVNDPPTAQDVEFEGIQEDSEDNLLDVMSNDLVGNPDDPVGEENADPPDDITLVEGGLGTPDQGGTVAIEGDEISYTPAPDFFGTETFEYTIEDVHGETDTATVTVEVENVNDPPTARDVEFEGIQEDSEDNLLDVMSNDLVGNVGDPVGEENADPSDDITLVEDALGTPSQDGTVAIVEGKISYTPAPDFFGTETFEYTIEDAHGETDTATVTVTVDNVNDPPTARDVEFEGIQEDSEDNRLDVMSNDLVGNVGDPVGEENAGPPDDITLVEDSLGTPDQGGTVAIVGREIGYTPAPDFFGTETFEYTIVDSHGETDTATVTVEVENVNDPPIPADTTWTATERRDEEDPSTILDVLDGARPGPPNESDQSVSLEGIVEEPEHGTLVQDGNKLIYTPDLGVLAGTTDTFRYEISDGDKTTEATATVEIVPFDRPYARDDDFSVEEDDVLEILVADDLLSNDLANEGFDLQFELLGGAENGVVTHEDGVVTYTPEADYFGEDSFQYEIDDEFVDEDDNPSEPSIGTVWIDVLPVNDPPTARDVEFEGIQEDSEDNRLDVMSNDLLGNVGDPVGEENADPPDDITLVEDALGTPDQGGTVAIVGDEISYTPAPDFFGTETFEYTIEDSHGETDTATVTVTVENVNDPPTAIDTIFPNIQEDSVDNSLNVMLDDFVGRPNAEDGPEDFIELVSVEGPSEGGTATIDGDVVLYTPASDFFGTETFEYTIQDSYEETDTATITVFVNNVNDPPPAINEDGVDDDRLMALKDFGDQELDVLANEREADNPDGDEILTLKELIGQDADGNEVRGTTVPTKHGTVSISADDMKVIYTPDAGFETEEGEFDSFGYVVRDDSGAENDSAEAWAEIDVIDAVPSDISGVIYIDANGDGIQQSDELTLSGVEVTLTGTNIRDSAVDLTVKTDANGEFVFSGVLPTAENSETGYSLTAEQPSFLEDGGETIIDSAVDDDYDPGQVHDDHFSNITLGVWGANGRASENYTFGESGLKAEYIKLTQFLSSSDPTMMLATDGEGDTFWFSIVKNWEGVKSASFEFDDIATSEGLATGQLTITDTNDVEHTRSLSYYEHYDFSGDPQDGGVVVFLKGSAADLGFDLSAHDPSAQAEGEMLVEDDDLELLATSDSAGYQEAVDAVFSEGNWA